MNWFNKIRKSRWALRGRAEIKKIIEEKRKNQKPIKIILGAGYHSQTSGEWVNTDLPQFDVTNESHWKYLFENIKIDNLFAEHVFEHLTLQQNKIAINLIYQYLKPGGVFRFVVPDGYNPDKNYIDYVKPNGTGPGCNDHKLLWNIDLMLETFSNSGFMVISKENYSKEGILFSSELNKANGEVIRTVTNPDRQNWELKNYSSLIIDFVKK